jgi:hypothetical protein
VRAQSWINNRSPRTQAVLKTLNSYKSQKRFYEGANREVFRGVDAGYDWRHVEMRDNTFGVQRFGVEKADSNEGWQGGYGSNVGSPQGDLQPAPVLSGSKTPENTMSASANVSIGSQPTGALNPAVPRTMKPVEAPQSVPKRSEFFATGSTWAGKGALPPLSQPGVLSPQRKQREILGV